jgi:DNA-binding MarR family transcriptional regulator
MDGTHMDDRLLYFQVFNEIGIIHQLASAEFRKALGVELNESEFGVLNHFVRMGDGKTPSQLATIFQVTKPSMTATISKLVQKGYVKILSEETDKRKKIVKLTAAGKERREQAITAVLPLAEEGLASFGVARLKEILPTLMALREHMDLARQPVQEKNE